MRFSVIIPAYNCEKTILATLESVFLQTVLPTEILVFDDGSSDGTADILEKLKPRIKIFRQHNQGVAHARNFLCAQAEGEILAFLDSDDLWHPLYLETQSKLIEEYPEAIAVFTQHEDFVGFGSFQWSENYNVRTAVGRVLLPRDFLDMYDKSPMQFQMSCCCVRRRVVSEIPTKPFLVSGAEDTYFHNLLPLIGPVVHSSARFAAYRITNRSLSSNRLKVSLLVLDVFEILEKLYAKSGDARLQSGFRMVYASRKRNCGKFLMSLGKVSKARAIFKESLRVTYNPSSLSKSFLLMVITYLPNRLHPKWPEYIRDSESVAQ